jgi:hypothetical protein
VAQKSEGDIRIGDFYAAVEVKTQNAGGRNDNKDNRFGIQAIDDYFMVLTSFDGEKIKLSVYDYFDV